MLPATCCPPAPPTADRLRRWADALRRWWATPARDPADACLAHATDLADLDRRLRRLERGRADRFGPLPP